MTNLDLLFDEGQMILELRDLAFSGTGSIKDPKSGNVEKIKLNAPVSAA